MDRTFHILLVEDNPADVRLVREALVENGIRVELHVLHDGQAAVDWVTACSDRSRKEWRYSPDLILLDLNLPRVDGHDVLKIIKGNERTRSVPVIVLTTSNNGADVLAAYNHHANCYIQKPNSLDEMFRFVRTLQTFWMGIAKLPTRVAS